MPSSKRARIMIYYDNLLRRRIHKQQCIVLYGVLKGQESFHGCHWKRLLDSINLWESPCSMLDLWFAAFKLLICGWMRWNGWDEGLRQTSSIYWFPILCKGERNKWRWRKVWLRMKAFVTADHFVVCNVGHFYDFHKVYTLKMAWK